MKIKPIHYYFALGIAILIIGIVFLINCIINFSKCEIEYSELTYEELTFTGYKKISGYRGSTTYNIHFRGYVKPFKISTITQKYLDEDLIENLNENQIMKVYYRSTADKDYAYDIYHRYAHGEMTSADSMKVDTTVVYYTVKGRKVYGGGGIIPDVFVPIDTTRATKFHITCNRKATSMRFASAMFDKYKGSLSGISDFDTLVSYLGELDLEHQFLDYASGVDGLRPAAGEWEQSKEYMLPQIYGLVGRYSKVGEEAFYRFYLPIDETIQAALKK